MKIDKLKHLLNPFEENLDFAILEIGVGGKYDPVNLIESDISVITNIDLDHEKENSELLFVLKLIGIHKH